MHHFEAPPENIVRLDDPEAGLDGYIVVPSTRLGPAAGGCRLWSYDSSQEALEDALRLARGMAFKNALAGLPVGGGKAVLRLPKGDIDWPALFMAFARAVEELSGEYVMAEDVGTSVEDMMWVRQHTRYAAGLSPRENASWRRSVSVDRAGRVRRHARRSQASSGEEAWRCHGCGAGVGPCRLCPVHVYPTGLRV